MIKNYHTLVLSGGGVKGIAFLGALQCLKDMGMLDPIQKMIGTSIGSIIMYLITIGYTPVEIMVILCQNDLFERLSSIDCVHLLHGKGASSFMIIQEFLEKMTLKKVGRFLTLMDVFREYGMTLVFVTYNKTQDKIEYLSIDNYPEMPCLTAIRMSSSIPFMFDTFEYNQCVYYDGGMGDNFPISQIREDEPAIGFHFCSDVSSSSAGLENLILQFHKIVNIPIKMLEEYSIRNKPNSCDIVSIEIDENMSSLALTISRATKFDLFSTGYNTVRAFFEDPEFHN
jgi:NTE family protein